MLMVAKLLYSTPSIGAGSAHSLPSIVINHLMQQLLHPVSLRLPLKATRRDESVDLLVILHAVEGSGPSSIPPSGI